MERGKVEGHLGNDDLELILSDAVSRAERLAGSSTLSELRRDWTIVNPPV